MPCRRLTLAAVAVDVAVLAYHVRQADWQIADGSALSALSALALLNMTVVIAQAGPGGTESAGRRAGSGP